MNTMQDKTVVETIRAKYGEIFSAEKKVADFILQNPEKAVNANVSELANYSGVSDATVIRLCKHVGYSGYHQLRIKLSRDLGRNMLTDSAQAHNTVNGLFMTFASRMIVVGRNLSETLMLECANLINNCGHAHVVAVGNTSPLSQYMGFRLGRLGVKCTYNSVPECFMNHVNLADQNDIVIAISQSGSSKQVVQALELAKEKGLKILAITSREYSPVSRLADYLLLSGDRKEETSFNYYKDYSHLMETAVIDALLHFVTNEESIAANAADKPEIILSEYKL